MFRITRDPSSGSFIQCLPKITIMVLSCPLAWTQSMLWQNICPWCVCVLHCLERHSSAVHTYTTGKYAAITPTTSMPTDTIEPLLSREALSYLPVVRMCTALSGEALECLSRQCGTHMHHGQICCHNTDYVHVNGHNRTITVILAKHCIKLPDDGSLVIRNMLQQF